MESARPDAIFRDPYAARLAGPEGEAIVRAMPRGRSMAWPLVVRTAVLDEIILRLVASRQIDAVINLACGLDARPWRLELPPEFRWTDVDHPELIQYKTTSLLGETPRCRYQALSADLADQTRRRALLADLGDGAPRTLAITEGLLVYLAEPEVKALATDLHAVPSIGYWLTDLASPALLKMLARNWGRVVAQGNAPFRFGPENAPQFFSELGWLESEYRSTFLEGRRLKRSFPLSGLWHALARLTGRLDRLERFSGMALLTRH